MEYSVNKEAIQVDGFHISVSSNVQSLEKNNSAIDFNITKSPLTQGDLIKLAESFITEEIAKEAKLFRVDSTTGAELVGRKASANNDYSGIVFPYVLPGETTPREYRLRRDKPDLEEENGKLKEKAKYLSPPGRSNKIYFPPNCRKEWLEDVSLPIVITEGEKKVLALHRAALHDLSDSAEKPRFLPIGLSGVWNFRGSIGKATNSNGERQSVKGLIPDFRLINLGARRTTILYDSNVATNNSVALARRRLGKVLKEFRAKAFFPDLPQIEGCNGIDDVLGKIEREQDTDKACEFLFNLLEKASEKDSTVNEKSTNFEVREDGVYWFDAEGNEIRICSKLEILAKTRDVSNKNWGRLLSFKDHDAVQHQWAMPMSLLAGDGSEFRRELLSQGLEINHYRKAKDLLTNYIQSFPTTEKMRCVSRIGWFGESFVFPDVAIQSAGSDESLIFQSESFSDNPYQTRGTLQQWQTKVSSLAIGNSRLVFGISAAFAACLLPILDEQGCGFNFWGPSSLGKSTNLMVSGSVWGGNSDKGFIETWRSTANGLEAVAEMHNHALLCLDEIKECDPKTIGQTAYMLVNGQGKIRMSKNTSLRKRLEWNLFFLSSGELRISDLIEQTGERVYGGQMVRLIDLDADAGAGFGLFENPHGFVSANAFADELRNNSKKYYGTAIRAYLVSIIGRTDELKVAWHKFKAEFLHKYLPKDATGEVQRVCVKFALVAFAGETSRNVSLWKEGEAIEASAKLFQSWLSHREGNTNSDTEAAIRQIRHFLEAHGMSRFQNIGDTNTEYPDSNPIVANRVGFRRKNRTTDETEYLVLPESFKKELCKGFNPSLIAKELADRGFLIKASDSKNTRNERIDGEQKRVYVISSNIFEMDDVQQMVNAASAS